MPPTSSRKKSVTKSSSQSSSRSNSKSSPKAAGKSTRRGAPRAPSSAVPAATPPRARKALIVAALVAGGVLVPVGVLVGVLDSYGQADRARPADAIVVLGAQVRPDGSAGYGLQSRVLHALRLYEKGVAPRIICTGGVGENPPAEAEVAAKILRTRGVPRDAVLLENKSTSTWENAAYSAKICRAHNIKNVVVVSDPFHLWRAERNFAKNGISAWGAPVAREQWRLQPLRKAFWTTREAFLVIRDFVLRRV